MFSKSRRPVPSRGALRVLYQLAYISSGTAVGVAALCAEERRRRTHYVQKIADNARRLRQSPRHVHNVAVAKVTEQVVSQDSGDRSYFWEEQSRRDQKETVDDHVRTGIERAGPGERLVRAFELPSVVETGYSQVTKNHKRVRRRLPFREEASQHGAGESKSRLLASKSASKTRRHRPLSMQLLESGKTLLGTQHRKTRSTDHFQLPSDTHLSDDLLPVVQPRPKFRLKEAADLVEDDTFCDTGRNAAVVKHDVEVFFHSVPWTASDLTVEAQVASRLMREGLQHGCLKEIRQLVSWMLANDKLTEEDVISIHEAHRNSKLEAYNLLDLFELFAELFESKAFQKLPEPMKLSTAISVAADSSAWDVDVDEPTRARRLLHSTLRSSQSDNVDQAIRVLCDSCLAAGQSRRAYDVVTLMRKVQTGSYASTAALNRRWKAVYESIMEYAMKHGQLWICVKYATLLLRARDDPDRVPLVAWILQECRRRKTYVPAREIVAELLHLNRWRVLPDQAKVNLALAVSVVYKRKLDGLSPKKLFHAIPEALRGPVTEAWCADRLQMLWKTKRSLPAVWAEYERAKTFQFESFGTAELTLIEICNNANLSDEALKLLSNSFQQEDHNATSLCVAAVSMAQKSAWIQLRGLMDLIATSGMFVNDDSTCRNLNNTIQIYSRRHTAAETWNFVTDMVAKIGFAPNKITTDIMLQCFVSKQTLNLIPEWIQYLRTIGNDFQMTSSTATKLLSCFYFDQRPPHALLAWFSRNLDNKWPCFDARGLRELVISSIGYDLRELPAQNKVLLRESAGQTLANVVASGGGIPAPYRPTSSLGKRHLKPSPDGLTRRHEQAHGGQSSFKPLGQQEQQKGDVLYNMQSDHSDAHNPVKVTALSAGSSQDLTRSFEPDVSGDVVTRDEDFVNLRPQYNVTGSEDSLALDEPGISTEVPEYIHEGSRQRRVLREMILALSLRHYHTVMELYQASLSSSGLPASTLSLEVATEASIRLQKGGIEEATAMIDKAEKAGMEVRRAMGPLLVHRIHSLKSAEKKDANALRTMVIDYYRSNEENGFPVKHHVGITAANTLINNHRAEYGINILNAIYHSEWAMERPLEIVAMTVYLKGYAMLRSENGIEWVLQQVLQGNMVIDRRFISALKDACRSFGVPSVVRRTQMGFDRTGFVGKLRTGRQQCIERRHQQRFETKKFGNLLVKKILQCVELEKRTTVVLENREEF